MDWYVGPRVKCDMVSYGGVSMTGPRYVVYIFPTGSRKGTFRTHELKSMAIVAPVGTRIILATDPSRDGWQQHPWRCIRMVEGSMFTNDKGQKGVRIPDLDWLDPFDAKKTNLELQTGFPQVARLEDGTGYTFGRTGGVELKDHIRAIWVERESDPISGVPALP